MNRSLKKIPLAALCAAMAAARAGVLLGADRMLRLRRSE